jgi:hypothetical protein
MPSTNEGSWIAYETKGATNMVAPDAADINKLINQLHAVCLEFCGGKNGRVPSERWSIHVSTVVSAFSYLSASALLTCDEGAVELFQRSIEINMELIKSGGQGNHPIIQSTTRGRDISDIEAIRRPGKTR